MWSSCFCKVCYHWERNQKLWWLTAQLRANHAIRPWALYKRNIAHILHENFWSWHGVQHKAPAFFKLPFLLNSLRFQQRQLLADVRLWRKVSFPWEFNVATVLRYVGLAALYWGGSFQTVVLSDVNFLLASFALQGSRRQDYRLCTSLLLARGALHSTTESHTTRRSWLRKISWSESDILFRGVVHVYIIYTHIIVWWLYIYTLYGLGTVLARHRFNTFLLLWFDFSSDNFLFLETCHVLNNLFISSGNFKAFAPWYVFLDFYIYIRVIYGCRTANWNTSEVSWWC